MQQITDDLEKELLEIIITHLRSHEMHEPQARKLAHDFLLLLPLEDKQDLLQKLYALSKRHRETKELYLKYAKPIEEEDRQKKLALMSDHIKNGQIEHAINIAKGENINE